MGFKDGQGIGGFKKLAVTCIEPVIRPKGLGLGAARPKPQASVLDFIKIHFNALQLKCEWVVCRN